MKKPKHFMEDMEVEFVSLVDKAANKQKFKIYKADDQTENKGAGVQKNHYGVDEAQGAVAYLAPMITSFKDALSAKETSENLERSKMMLDEYFWILKCVLKSVVADVEVTNKVAGMKKAIDEFKLATVDLFEQVPVEKQAQIFGIEEGGSDMNRNVNSAAPTTDAIAKAAGSKGGAAEGGASQNAQAEGQNRPTGNPDKIDGVTAAGGKKMTKAELETEVQKKKQMMDEKKKKIDEEMKKAAEELAALEIEVAKAGTDQNASSGRDTVASNGAEGTVAPDHAVAGVQKFEGANAAAIGAVNPPATPSQALRQEVSLEGGIGAVVESFKKQIDVSLQGVMGSVTELLKQQEEKLKTMIDQRVGGVEKNVTSLRKTAGISNAGIPDFDTSTEKERATVEKGEDGEWSKALDGFGGFRKAKK